MNWQRFRHFHLTHPDNIRSILSAGLLANEAGDIFLATSPAVLENIARDQLFLTEAALFGVYSRGLTGQKLPDDVAELTAKYHVRLRQPHVASRFLRFVGVIRVREETEWDRWIRNAAVVTR